MVSATGLLPALFHCLGFLLFGLDFFQLILLVDLIHVPCTVSVRSHPASGPSRYTCKCGQLSLLCGWPGHWGLSQLVAPLLRGPRLSIHSSCSHLAF